MLKVWPPRSSFPLESVAQEEGLSTGPGGGKKREMTDGTTAPWDKNKRCCFGDSQRESLNKEQSKILQAASKRLDQSPLKKKIEAYSQCFCRIKGFCCCCCLVGLGR